MEAKKNCHQQPFAEMAGFVVNSRSRFARILTSIENNQFRSSQLTSSGEPMSAMPRATRPVTKIVVVRLIRQIEFMTEINKISRIAGLIYLGVVLTGLFSLMYVPSKLINYDNASLTFQNLTASEMLFRFGIVSGVLCYIFFLFLPIVLYKLLRQVNEEIAKLMVLLALISVPMYFVNLQNELTALSLIKAPNYLNVFSTEQIQSQVLLYINQYDNGMRLIHIFSGLWLFPFGYLVFKSNFLPKILGILLMLGCFGYLINFFGSRLISNYSELGISSYISLPASLGEIGTCLWLIIIGAKEKFTSSK